MAKRTRTRPPELAFALVAERGWRLQPGRAGRRAGCRWRRSMPSCRPARLARRARPPAGRADARHLPLAELDGMTPRERVFELMMRRFDAMAPYKGGFARPRPRRRPATRPCWVGPVQCRPTHRWLLDAAEAPTARPSARSPARCWPRSTPRVFNVWLDDDTPDLARTLAGARPPPAAGRERSRAGRAACAAGAAAARNRAERRRPSRRLTAVGAGSGRAG